MNASTHATPDTEKPATLVSPPRYQLVSRIATGGMAEVFLAIMPDGSGATKPVVIKRLWPELARDRECVEMFLNEVRLSLRLSHPNVIHAYESGHDGDRYYLTMEYLDGQSLKHVLDRFTRGVGESAISLPLAIKIVSDVLTGLDYVHGLTDLDGRPLQVVHRDVSPQNVFITCDGTVKLIDFGIAQFGGTHDRKPTREPKGRLAYMAPEQVAGAAVDQRADLFSVGVLLWEMSVGRRLWQGQADAEIRGRLLSGEAIPHLPKSQGFPPGLAAICSRALAIDRAERYQSAMEFQADLAVLLTGSMPVQTRILGDMVAEGFASSRALSRSMIQQSLPGLRRSRSSSSHELLRMMDGDVVSDGEVPSASNVSSTYSIASSHEEITQVLPPVTVSQLRPRLIPLWLVTGVILSAFAGGIAFICIQSLRGRPPGGSPGVVLPSSEASSAALRKETLLESLDAEPVHATVSSEKWTVPLTGTVSSPRSSSKRILAERKPDATRATVGAATEASGATPPAVQDFFEIRKLTGKRPMAHAIDREDPYRR